MVEAFRIGFDDIPSWFKDAVLTHNIGLNRFLFHESSPKTCGQAYCDIITPEGTMRGDYGDFIIQGVNGEVYPCNPEIFEKTYEPV